MWENTSQGFKIGLNWLSILILALVYFLLSIAISSFLTKSNKEITGKSLSVER